MIEAMIFTLSKMLSASPSQRFPLLFATNGA